VPEGSKRGMASTKNRTREELIAIGYCPICSKCTTKRIDERLGWFAMLHECRRCGTLLLSTNLEQGNPLPPFCEVTERLWDEIKKWYEGRRGEVEAQKGELEEQFRAEVPTVILKMIQSANPPSLKLVKG
jgi:hypothetical protein